MEWSAPAIVLSAAPYGEGDALAVLFTQDHGVFRGLARGGLSRAKASTWQAGNLVEARWVARLADQLGSFTAELVHASAAEAMQDPLALGILQAACAVAEQALPERQRQVRSFRGLLHLIAHLDGEPGSVEALVEWELGVLAELGYGLALSRCAVTGASDALAYVSPRTGCAVSAAAAGEWRGRLLALPHFLGGCAPAAAGDALDGLRLSGHFLARDALGVQNRPLPAARRMLQDRVERQLARDAAPP